METFTESIFIFAPVI